MPERRRGTSDRRDGKHRVERTTIRTRRLEKNGQRDLLRIAESCGKHCIFCWRACGLGEEHVISDCRRSSRRDRLDRFRMNGSRPRPVPERSDARIVDRDQKNPLRGGRRAQLHDLIIDRVIRLGRCSDQGKAEREAEHQQGDGAPFDQQPPEHLVSLAAIERDR
jgi:hypothetical protein